MNAAIHPHRAGRKDGKTQSFLLACVLLLLTGIGPATADVLRGHLSGLSDNDAEVDLRVRFFDASATSGMISEHQFREVALHDGHFSIVLDRSEVPRSAKFVEIALRPSARPYAAFQTIPPRRRLQRLNGSVLVASVAKPVRDHGVALQITGSTSNPNFRLGETP